MILGFLLRTEQWMRGLKSTLVAFRSGKALPFSTLGFVTLMQSLIKASSQNKSTASMRVRKRERMPAGCWKSHTAPLFHWYLLPQEEWQTNWRGITVHWLNFHWLKKRRGLWYYNVMDSRQSLIRPPEVSARLCFNKACNIACRAELGRFPLNITINQKSLKYILYI